MVDVVPDGRSVEVLLFAGQGTGFDETLDGGGDSEGQAHNLAVVAYFVGVKDCVCRADGQSAKLAWIAKTDPRLHRAYLLKEGLRHVFTVKGEEGKQALDRWVSWARRSRIPAFVDLARKIVKHRTAIDAAATL